ncbi:MAG: glycosyltransferase family 2 protein, partial [Finegoldia magna]|nr:glycosyltransferase family 2 protein [Finegoldia magna]
MNYVVIPAYKPDEKLTKLVENLSENHLNIIVVKDGPCDYDFSKLNNIVLLEHHTNMGKGAALKTAFKYLKSQQADGTVVTSDADGQHLVKDILKLIEFSEQNEDKLILGVRDLKRGIPLKSLLGNTITRFVFYSSSSKYIKDTQTGLRAFNTSNLDKMIEIEGERYEYEMNMLYEFDSESIMQVPIETIYIENNETSHFNALKDSAKIYKSILKFSASSYLSFLVDYFTFIL